MIIKKKLWKDYYDRIATGKKKFDIRLADFEIKEGDTLVLEEWDQDKKAYTGRSIKTKATYVAKINEMTFWPQDDIDKYGFQVIQIDFDK